MLPEQLHLHRPSALLKQAPLHQEVTDISSADHVLLLFIYFRVVCWPQHVAHCINFYYCQCWITQKHLEGRRIHNRGAEGRGKLATVTSLKCWLGVKGAKP